MGRRYHGKAVGVAAGTSKTILQLISAATIRPALYDLIVGSDDTPADQATRFAIRRFTAVGTEGGGFTPVALDPANPASLADYGVGVFSVEPTYTANSELLVASVNQRATFRWIAAPGGELVAPATAGNGLGLESQASTGTPGCEATMYHEE